MLSTSILPHTNIVIFTYGGSLSTQEVETARGDLRWVIGEQGSGRILLEFGEVKPGLMQPAAVWEDLESARLLTKVDRFAVVADQTWLKRLGTASDLLPGIEIRSFDREHRDAAVAWLKG